MKLAVVGGGWAGFAAAVRAAESGAHVSLFEATATLGGRARLLKALRPDGVEVGLDNGQHILIGAYRDTLACMQRVGVVPEDVVWGMSLALPFPDNGGLQTPPWAARWPAPLDALAAIATTPGWRWHEKVALLRRCLAWRIHGFVAPAQLTVAQLCQGLPDRILREMIEPLCVSALNLPASQASASVFLRVLKDALLGQGFGNWKPSSLLLPRKDLSALWPQAAAEWLQTQTGQPAVVRTSARIRALYSLGPQAWLLQGEHSGTPFEAQFDAVILATGATAAARILQDSAADMNRQTTLSGPAPQETNTAQAINAWAHAAATLPFTAITTVYAWAPGFELPRPMLALRAEPDAEHAPAQFVFDRGQLQAHEASAAGVLAFVISASQGERQVLERQVLAQAMRQLAPLGLKQIHTLLTVVEKRATFACVPGLQRPGARITKGLWAAGDYVEGPYPATLEAAVRSGLAAAQGILQE